MCFRNYLFGPNTSKNGAIECSCHVTFETSWDRIREYAVRYWASTVRLAEYTLPQKVPSEYSSKTMKTCLFFNCISDVEDYQERKRNGGWQKRGYVEGWVEFMDKKIAKKFVRRYNGEPIGGKKHNPFYEEIWCVKYLSKFKWDHLLEGIRTSSHYLYIQTPSL